MSDFGLKLSQEGHDVKNAKDYKLSISSSWYTLPIVAQGTTPAGTIDTATMKTHSLDFYPMFWIWKGGDIFDSSISGASGKTSMYRNDQRQTIKMDKTKLFLDGFGGNTPQDLRWMIFNVDLEEEFIAPNPEPGLTTDADASRDKDFGIKVSMPGKDVHSTDLRNFSVHSGTRSPLIHSITQHSHSSAQPTTIEHNLGYAPMFFAYFKGADGYLHIEFNPESSFGVYASADENEFNMTALSGDFTVVLLKDPILSK